tara:strand:+ start:165 stop:938 length:774 start_codon:yes stop_codon:yes gene_type:complete
MITIQKDVPLPSSFQKTAFSSEKTIHKVLRTMDVMKSGDSILISTNSNTGRLITHSTLDVWIKKYYMSRYNLSKNQYKRANNNGCGSGTYNLDMFTHLDEYEERSVDIDPETKEYVWTAYNSTDRNSERASERIELELDRCKKENDYTMEKEHLWSEAIHKLCTKEIPKELVESAKMEQYKSNLDNWRLLGYQTQCKTPIPTLESTKLDWKEDAWGALPYWLSTIHRNHECEYEHPMVKKWNEQEVVRYVGIRLWRL